MPEKDDRIKKSIALTQAQWDEIESFRATHGIGDTNEAVRYLITIGLRFGWILHKIGGYKRHD
jgi:acetate kinase